MRSAAWILIAAIVSALPADGGQVPWAPADVLEPNTPISKALAAADLDRDGDLDFLAASTQQIVWFEQLAGVGFVPHVITTLGDVAGFPWVELGDMDHDGDLDVVYTWYEYVIPDWRFVVKWRENRLASGEGWSLHGVRENTCNAFACPPDNEVNWVATGDFDGDGNQDVAWGDNEGDDGRLWFLESDYPDSTFSGHVVDDWTENHYFSNLQPADVDGDGDLDLVATDRLGLTSPGADLVWYENDGTPLAGQWPQRDISLEVKRAVSHRCAALADLDLDGDLDAAIGDIVGDDLVYWYENDGSPADGLWPAHDFSDWDDVCYTAGDLDGDGDPDLVPTGGYGWLENDRTPADGDWPAHSLPAAAIDPRVVADLDGDGDQDLVGFSGGRLAWHGNLTLHRSAKLGAEQTVSGLLTGVYDLLAADLDGDGDTDLVSVTEASDAIYKHRNTGNLGFWPLSTIGDEQNGPRAVAAGDLDGDGDLDLVVGSYNDATVAWYENDGSNANWTPRAISVGAGGAHDVAVADLDGDGDLDVACAQYLDGEISWYRNNGGLAPTFTPFFVDSSAPAGPRALTVSDVDLDGRLDLVVVAGDADELVWYRNDGTPAVDEWSEFVIDDDEIDDPRDVVAVDLDRDGDDDLVVASYAGDHVKWFENDGSLGDWTGRTANASCLGARGLAAADLDADGDPDLLAACYDEDRIRLLTNNGANPPAFSSTIFSQTANGVRALVAADFDRDGDLDVAAAEGLDNQVSWYENRGGQFRIQATTLGADPIGGDDLQGVLRLVVTHRGRSGDGSLELSAVAVRLEESPGDPLTAFQAASLLDAVAVYADDGDFLFDPASDPLLASAPAAGIDAGGVVWVALPDGSPAAAIAALGLKAFFVVLDLAQPPGPLAPKTVRVTALTDGPTVCQAEHRAYDLPLTLEWAANVSTETLCAGPTEVVLSQQTVTTTASWWACDTLTAHDGFEVGAGGAVTLEAANLVVLGAGFSVAEGGTLSVRSGPPP